MQVLAPLSLAPCRPYSSPSLLDRRSHTMLLHRPIIPLSNYPAYDDPDATALLRPNRTSTLFRPLPSITASPLCTPAASLHSQGISLSSLTDERLDLSDSPTITASSPLSNPMSDPPHLPTWIATPPTPPRGVRRACCLSTRRSAHFPASASFPASLPSHERQLGLRRSASLPSMLPSSSRFSAYPRPSASALSRRSAALTPSGSPITQFVPVSGTVAVDHETAVPTRARFHISHDPLSDNEDDAAGAMLNDDLQRSATSGSQKSSGSGASTSSSSSQDNPDARQKKDDIRRYHALMELLSTEVSYLMDLRALVNVYLRFIHIVASQSANARSSLGFSRSRPHSLQSALLQPDPTSRPSSPCDPFVSNKDKGAPKPLLSAAEVEMLTRNAEDILVLHEHFVAELRAVVAPLGFRVSVKEDGEMACDSSQIERVDDAIRKVATKFTTEASRFKAYETFCTGHLQALEVVRKVQQRHPTDWDIFEQLASSVIASTTYPFDDVSEAVRNHAPAGLSLFNDLPDGSTRALRARSRLSASFDTGPRTKDTLSPRLALMDYLIKPIQRICQYQLLLAQLVSRERTRSQDGSKWFMTGPEIFRSDVDVVVESALQAMKHVASAVDEARRKQDISIQSSLVVSRMLLAPPLPPQSSKSQPLQVLTPMFLTSLGACLLAGSLDVMQYPVTGDIVKAKYLGAFLYMGGYLVLVKVCKGKVYEPRHWFSLADFELLDLEEEEAMLPCSFRLSSKSHHFELAAACRREKETWISSLRESLTVSPVWINEPLSSLQMDGKDEFVPCHLEEEPYEILPSLPTIQSIPESGNDHDLDDVPVVSHTTRSRLPLKIDIPSMSDNVPPSRRSSTASVKAIWSPLSYDPDTITIRRSLPSARALVDQGLLDVISAPCREARSHASRHEEELFQAPKITRSNLSMPGSGLSMAGAMGVAAKNRLTKHQSVRVPRRRSLVDRHDLEGMSGKRRVARTKSLISKRPSRLVLTPVKGIAERRIPNRPSWDIGSAASSQCSSLLASPTMEALSLTSPSAPSKPEPSSFSEDLPDPDQHRPKRTRSMIDSVRGFLHLLPKTSELPVPTQYVSAQGQPLTSTVNSGLLRRWTFGPFHRRTRSTPDVKRILPTTWVSEDGHASVSNSAPKHPLPGSEFGVDSNCNDCGTVSPHIYHLSPTVKRRSFLTACRFTQLNASHSSPGDLRRRLSLSQPSR